MADSDSGELSEAQISIYKQDFDEFDHNHDGFLDLEETAQVLVRQIGSEISDELKRTSFNTIDTDQDGLISFSEYMYYVEPTRWKGYSELNKLRPKDGVEVDDAAQSKKMEQAAIKIQTSFRGKIARKKVECRRKQRRQTSGSRRTSRDKGGDVAKAREALRQAQREEAWRTLRDEKLEKYEADFNKYDVDKDELLDEVEFAAMLRDQLGRDIDAAELKATFSALNVTRADSYISFSEYMMYIDPKVWEGAFEDDEAAQAEAELAEKKKQRLQKKQELQKRKKEAAEAKAKKKAAEEAKRLEEEEIDKIVEEINKAAKEKREAAKGLPPSP